MNPQHTNHYYNLEFTVTDEQLELQRDMPIREIVRMQQCPARLTRQIKECPFTINSGIWTPAWSETMTLISRSHLGSAG